MATWVILSVVFIGILILMPLLRKIRSRPIPNEELAERRLEIPGDPTWPDEFRPIVEMARGRFPDCHVWGQYIHGGKGYGIFVSNGVKKSMFQVKSSIKVTTEKGVIEADNDIRKAKDIKEAIRQAFDAMEKSLNDPGGLVATRSR
jgi:hypothetical protein